MMLMLLVFFIATDMKIKELGRVNWILFHVSLYCLLKPLTVRRLLKKTKFKASLAIFLPPSNKKRELNPTLCLNKANTIHVLALMLQLGMHMYKMQSLKSLIVS